MSGIIVALIFPMLIMPQLGVDKSKWIVTMSILSCIALPLTLMEYYFTKERITLEGGEQKKDSVAMVTQLKAIFSDKYMIIIFIYFLIFTVGSTIKISRSFISRTMSSVHITTARPRPCSPLSAASRWASAFSPSGRSRRSLVNAI